MLKLLDSREETKEFFEDVLKNEIVEMIALTDEEDAPEQLYVANRDGEFNNAILNNLRMVDGILRNIINLSDIILDNDREAIRDLTQATIEGIKAGDCDARDMLDMIEEGIEEDEENLVEFRKRCDRVRDLLDRAEESAKRYWEETTRNFSRAGDKIREAIELKGAENS